MLVRGGGGWLGWLYTCVCGGCEERGRKVVNLLFWFWSPIFGLLGLGLGWGGCEKIPK